MLIIKRVRPKCSLQCTSPTQSYQYDLKLKPGEWVAIQGCSGIGKSQMLDTIGGLLDIASGSITWHEQELTSLPPAQRPFAYLFQDNNLFDHLNLRTNLSLGIQPSGQLTKEERERLHQCAQRLGISALLNSLPGQISGGQRQRAALARVLLRQAPILLLDEPFSALDKPLRQECLDWLAQLQHENNLSIIMTTHHPEENPRQVRRLEMITGGKLIELSPGL